MADSQKLVRLIVDGEEFLVDEKLNLLDALKLLGRDIPHFCYHEELGLSGNCRMCLVEIKGQKRPQIACGTSITDGMEVCINSDLTRKVQREMMELELFNHPLDCPTCDQAGECHLQDYYMKYDGQKSRIKECEKIKKPKFEDFGSGVLHNSERCVLCTRCVRFTKQITKTNELGLTKRGVRAEIAIFDDNKINNAYAGCIADICPVGAMTLKDFRFAQRAWKLKSFSSICTKCAKGCNIVVDYAQNKYEDLKIYRMKPRINKSVNGHFICDIGRYSYHNLVLNGDISYQKEELRITEKSKINLAVLENLKKMLENAIFIISTNLALEIQYSVKKLAKLNDAAVFAYSKNKYQKGDGYLISDEISANAKSTKILDIEELESLDLEVKGKNIFIFDNSEALEELKGKNAGNIVHFSTSSRVEGEYTHLPIACYLQYKGLYINVDNILQDTDFLEVKDAISILDYANALSDGKISNLVPLIREEIKGEIEIFKEIDLNNIHKEGLKL